MKILAYALVASSALSLAMAEQVVISEIMYNPRSGAPEFIEISNNTSTPFDIAKWRFTDGIDFEFPDFSEGDPQASFLQAFEKILVSSVDEGSLRAAYAIPAGTRVFGPWQGSLSNGGERITLEDKNGLVRTTVEYDDEGKFSPAADGTGHSLTVINQNRLVDDWRNWRPSTSPGGTPGTEAQGSDGLAFPNPEVDLSSAFPIVELGGTWRYHDQTADLGTAWSQPGYDDSAWPEGSGLFGFESRELPAPGIQTPLRRDFFGGLTTYYLRKTFTHLGGTTGATISIDTILDDGAVFYLNGNEIGRVRMPEGPIDWQTGGQTVPVEGVIEEKVLEGDISGALVTGENVLAVEVHNESAGSSDVVFGATIRISAPPAGAVINEVLPGAAGAGFIEFFNPSQSPVSLQNYYLTDDPANLTKFRITANLVLPARGLGTIGFAEAGFQPGPSTNIYLVEPTATSIVNAIEAAIPLDGRSIGRKPSGGASWFIFADPTPGESNISASDLADVLHLSEIHLGADNAIDWVELHASSPGAIPVDGLFLATTNDFSDRIPIEGTIPGRGYKSWNVSFPDLGEEVTVYLVTGGGSVLAAERFRIGDSSLTGYQCLPPASREWYAVFGSASRDAANNPPRTTDIVINEIMCDPPSDSRNGEFVELYNRGTAAVDLSGWRFDDGINFTFPPGTSLSPGQYLVIAANQGWIRSIYGNINVIGDFGGNLRNEGELLRLVDARGNLADQVDYRVTGEWPRWVNGDGSSLELSNPMIDNSIPSAWKDSDESNKSTFQQFTFTGTYQDFPDERIGGTTSYKEFHLHLVGDSHLILRNVELQRNGQNLLQNANQMTPNGNSATGWLAQGTHWASRFEGSDFHLIADGHGDNRANKAEIDCTSMNARDELTISLQARWVQGAPRLIAQTFDHSVAASFQVPIPDNLGTPGARNSAYSAAPPPALAALRHDPPVPTDSDNVRIMARLTSVDPIAAVDLVYREDGSTNANPWKTSPMNDLGLAGDEIVGDGIYTATIGDMKEQGRIVQFYVSASTTNGGTSILPRQAPDKPAMYIVDNDRMDDDLTNFRWIVSAYDIRAFSSGQTAAYDYKYPRLSNSYKNMTLIVDESEIYYGCEIRPAGSPWHAGDRASLQLRGKFKFPADQRFRGLSKLTYDQEGAGSLHHNRICRYWLYLFGHPRNEDEFVRTKENARPPTFREVVEPVGNDMLDRHWVDGSQGELYRVDDIFRFDDSYNKSEITNRYWWYAGDEWRGPGRYHTEWLKRSREDDYDYSALINLLKTVSEDNYTEDEINRLVDAQKISQMAAIRGYIGDWDSFTMRRPKNSFFYRPPGDGKFHFFHWDSDLGFSAGENFGDGGREFRSWQNKPYNRRIFRYYLAELLDKYTNNSARLNAWFEAEENASNQYRMSTGTYTNFFNARRNGAIANLGPNYNRAFQVDQVPANTSSDTISITGSAGYKVWEVAVEGHPEAVFSWTGETEWRIDNVRLKSGENALSIVGLDDDGVPAAGAPSSAVTVNKTGNSKPILALETNPPSKRLGITELLMLDAGGSSDPEGQPLTFEWDHPTEGIGSFTPAADGTAAVSFTVPGLYTFTVTARDPGGAAASSSVDVSVFGANGFSSFSDSKLEPFWEAKNVEPLDNYSVGPWYSFEMTAGRLVLQVPDDTARPLGVPQPPLPDPITYVDLGDMWKFNDTNAELGSEYAQPDYDDSAWPTGGGLFGFESASLPEPGIQTPLARDFAGGLLTYYLRKEFEFDRDPSGSRITIDHIIDDGVRYFLNGKELGRVRLPAGDINSNTPADRAPIEGVIEDTVIDIDGSGFLVTGTNVLAAELHNESAGSSDAVFGARLEIASREITNGGGGLNATIHPWIRRMLPRESDWVIQTDLELETIQFGDFMTGLIVELAENGIRSRYAFGFRNGTDLAVVQVNAQGSAGILHSQAASSSDNMTIRIRRSGDQLAFEWENADAWEPVYQVALNTGTTAAEGGIFASTDSPEALRVAFDYFMLIDPSGISPYEGDLLITEVMYKPEGGVQYEFIELHNAGASPINMNGFRFIQGAPVDEFVFGNSSIQPGGYLLVVADAVAFRSRYGAALDPLVAGAWTGGVLSNAGEEITLLDSEGRLVASFRYEDGPPWPTGPDTAGASLVFNAIGATSLNDPSGWQASGMPGGSPGRQDGQTFGQWLAGQGSGPLDDPNGDGVINLVAYGLGVDLVAVPSDAMPRAVVVDEDGVLYPGITFRRRLGDATLVYSPEISKGFQGWSNAPADIVPAGAPAYGSDGTEHVTYRSTRPLSSSGGGAFRVRVSLP